MKDETRTRLLNEYKMMKKVLDGLNGIGAIKDDMKDVSDNHIIEQVIDGRDIESTEEIYCFMDTIDEYTRIVNEFTENKYKPLFYFYKNIESGELKKIHVSAKEEFVKDKIIIYPEKGNYDKENFYRGIRTAYFKHNFIDGEEKAVEYMKKIRI